MVQTIIKMGKKGMKNYRKGGTEATGGKQAGREQNYDEQSVAYSF